MGAIVKLIIEILFLAVLCIKGLKVHKNSSLRRMRRAKKEHVSRQTMRVLRIFNGVIALILGCSGIAAIAGAISVGNMIYNQINGNPTEYTFYQPTISRKTALDEVFDFSTKSANAEPVPEASTEADSPLGDSLLSQTNSRLHIQDEFVGAPITEEMLEKFCLIVERIYTDGVLQDYSPQPDLLNADEPSYLSCNLPYLQMAAEVYRNFKSKPTLSSEYVFVGYLANSCLTAEIFEISFPEMIELIADTLHFNEGFLRYENLLIDNSEISLEYIALVNGKLLLKNAPILKGHEDGDSYVNVLLAESYCIFTRMAKITDENNRLYFLFAYYAANAGQNLLDRIDYGSNQMLCNRIKEESLDWYRVALDCLASKVNYETERGIEDRIQIEYADLENKFCDYYFSGPNTKTP